MVLSDKSLKEEISKGRIVIRPFDPLCIQPAGIDVHLGRKILVFGNTNRPYIDVKHPADDLSKPIEITNDEPFLLHPGDFVLASTLEYIEIPEDIVGRLEGRSSLGRLGLFIHCTSGHIDPGWKGHLTLELSNIAKLPITLYYGMKTGQISFLRLTTPVEHLYGSEALGSKYQGQTEPIPSRYYQEFKRLSSVKN